MAAMIELSMGQSYTLLSTVNQSLWCYFNRVLREQRCESGCVGLVGCIVKLLSERVKLLAYFRIDRFFLLGKGRQSKADCQSYRAPSKRVFIVSSPGV